MAASTAAFTLIPRCIPRLIIERVVHYGIHVTRLSDPWNDYNVLRKEVADLKSLGMESVVNIIYSISPRHTDEYYARKAREAAALKPYRLCYKDVGGMLTPERARTLARLILDNAGDVPVEFHAHCNNGLAPFNLLEVVKQGVRIVHTSVPPLANGSAQPSIFNVVRNLRALGYKVLVNEKSWNRWNSIFAVSPRKKVCPSELHGNTTKPGTGIRFRAG
jgi:oxaloacetate decarboxylase alpha subunit